MRRTVGHRLLLRPEQGNVVETEALRARRRELGGESEWW
jgi:hypothetical protein